MPHQETIIKVTKLDAARRQLRTALELWFADGDPISIHSLVGSSYQVLHDLNRKAKGPPLLFDSPAVKKEFSPDAVRRLKEHMNFFKHADLRKIKGAPSMAIDFDPRLNDLYFLACVLGVAALGLKHTDHEAAFLGWRMLSGEGSLGEHGSDVLRQTLGPESVEVGRGVKKHEFLDYFLKSRTSQQNR